MLFVPVVNSVLSSVTRIFDTLTGKANDRNLNHRSAKTSSFSFTGSSTFTPSPGSDAMNAPKGLSPLIQEQRVIKSEAEIKLMRQAGEISGKAFIEVSAARMRFFKQCRHESMVSYHCLIFLTVSQTMKFTDPARLEHQVYAKFDFECRMRGSQMMAYVPVVAGGSNALTMHYVNNDQPLKDGDLILMDAGGVSVKQSLARDFYEHCLNAFIDVYRSTMDMPATSPEPGLSMESLLRHKGISTKLYSMRTRSASRYIL